ncbi:glutathione S-transferase U7-like [Tripterygium wilfordii]|uniref:glutathione S-transferase U7-like n=1 Tax=Tripterygium wilfordii TaxID=458696 RepID=UPI0018F7FF8F|nr:glutathione S-transferase U7-like [Tripterygium wilfordii]
MAEEVKLFGFWSSPYSRRVEVALKLKGIQYEYIEEDLFNKSPLLLQYNRINQKVPVLLHNGKPISESRIILEYIDETWKNNPILPQDPYERATARFWGEVIDDKILMGAWKAVRSENEEQKQAIEELHRSLKLLEKELDEKDFFGGDRVGYVDIVAFVIAHWLWAFQEAAEVELIAEEKFPVLCKWSRKLLEIQVVDECHPPRGKHVDYYRVKIEATKLSSK